MTLVDRPPDDVSPTPDGPPDPPTAVAGRVDPFALPPATTSQFVLLLVLTLVSASFTFDQILGGPTRWEGAYNACTLAADATSPAVAPVAVTLAYVDCFDATNLLRAGVALGVMGVVALLVGLAVLIHPWLVVRREGLLPLRDGDFPDAGPVLEQCVAEAGLARAPVWFVEPFRSQPGGRAFGHRPRPRVWLSATLLRGDPDRLRAVVRHELAHVVNRDLELTAVAIVVPAVFVLGVATPLLVLSALRVPTDVWPLGWRTAVLLAVLLVIRAAVFRSREHYADVRASRGRRGGAGDGGDGEYGPALVFRADVFADGRGARVRGRGVAGLRDVVRDRLAAHPATARRAGVVERPDALLRASAAENLAAGVTAGVSFCYLRNLSIALLGGDVVAASLFAGVVVGVLVAAVAGLGTWRAALASALTGRPPPSALRPALALAGGLMAGELLAPRTMSALPGFLLAHPVWGLLAPATLVAGCLAFHRWSATTAVTWLAASRARSLRTPARWGAVATVGFSAAYGLWFQSAAGSSGPAGGLSFLVGLLPVTPAGLLAVVVTLTFPLLAGLRATGPLSMPRRVHLDTPAPSRLPVARTRFLLLLLPPLVLGVLFVVVDATVLGGALLPLLLVAQDPTAPGEVAPAQLEILLGSVLAVVTCVMLVVLVLTGPRRVRSTLAHPVAAAILTACCAGAALFAYPSMVCGVNCRIAPLASGIGAMFFVGTLLALGVTVPAWSLALLVPARRRASEPDAEVGRTPGRRRLLAASAALVAVAVLGPVVYSSLGNLGYVAQETATVPDSLLGAPYLAAPNSREATCTAYLRGDGRPQSFFPDNRPTLALARTAQLSGAPTIYAIGVTMEEAVLRGDARLLAEANRALFPVCSRLVPS